MFEEIQGWLDAAIVQGSVIALVGLLALLLSKKAAASTRHLIAAGAILSMLMFALLSAAPLRMPVQRAVNSPLYNIQVIERTPSAVGEALTDDTSEQVDRRLSKLPAGAIVVGLYLSVAGILLLRLGAGCLIARRQKTKSAPASERVQGLANMAAVSVGLSQTPHLGMNATIQTPMALGGLRPAVLLPSSAEEWDDARLRSILEHEMAHVKRGDCRWQLVACVACALHWFNPLAWMLKRAMLNAAEKAADDAVLLSGTQPSDYASCLLESAKAVTTRQRLAVAVPLMRNQNLKGRIQAILSNEKRGRLQPMAMFVSFIVATATAALSVAAFTQDGRVANPASWAEDVRKGLSTPGSPSNDFTGVLRDGRTVEVYQLAQRRPNGSIFYWRPDGTPIDPKDATPVKFPKYEDLSLRVILVRAKLKPGSVEPMLTMGSGTYGPGYPSQVLYAGSAMLPSKDGYCISKEYIGVPKEDGEYFYFTATLYDDAWKTVAEISRNGELTGLSNDFTDPRVRLISQDTSERVAHWANGYTGPYAVIEFTERVWDNSSIMQLVAFDTNGKPLKVLDPDFGDLKDRTFKHSWYVKLGNAKLGKVQIQHRKSFSCEMNKIKVRPNTVP